MSPRAPVPILRAFKLRAGATIAVGGSEWDTLAMPMMGLFMLPLQVAVVDNIVVNWIGLPRTIALRDDLLERAHSAGKKVVEQLGKTVEEVEYLGDPGLCPLCHSKVIEVRHDGDVYPCICALCGVRGTLGITDGKVSFTVSDEDRPHSHLLLSGKFEHLDELANRSLKPPANMGEVPAKSAKYKDYLTPVEAPARPGGRGGRRERRVVPQPAPHVGGVFHAGVTVGDMERSLHFYRDVLGLEVESDALIDHPYVFDLTAVPATEVRVVFLRVPRSESTTRIELLEYRGLERHSASARPCDPGHGHLCLLGERRRGDARAAGRRRIPRTVRGAGGVRRRPPEGGPGHLCHRSRRISRRAFRKAGLAAPDSIPNRRRN